MSCWRAHCVGLLAWARDSKEPIRAIRRARPRHQFHFKQKLVCALPGGISESTMPPPLRQTPGHPRSKPRQASWNKYGLRVLRAIFAIGELDHRGVHVDKRNEIENRRGIHEYLVDTLFAVSSIWITSKTIAEITACTRMEISGVFQRGWILPNAAADTVDSHHKRHARDTRHRRSPPLPHCRL